MSTQTRTRPTPYQLADAITDMTMRYGKAERRRAYLVERKVNRGLDAYEQTEMDRLGRACRYRFAALQRLTEALRKQAEEQ